MTAIGRTRPVNYKPISLLPDIRQRGNYAWVARAGSRSRQPEKRACYRAGHTEPCEKPVPVGHAGCLCLLQDAERAFGVGSNEAAAAELGDDVSLPGDGLFTYRDVPLHLRETGAY